MAGASIQIDSSALARIQKSMARLTSNQNLSELLDGIGAEIETQTRRRIEEERESPAGEPWAEWSEKYRTTRKDNQEKLFNEGNLADSIQFVVEENEVHVGTNLIYGAIHQFGGEDVEKPELPARPYLGLSEENLDDLIAVVDDWVDEQLQ